MPSPMNVGAWVDVDRHSYLKLEQVEAGERVNKTFVVQVRLHNFIRKYSQTTIRDWKEEADTDRRVDFRNGQYACHDLSLQFVQLRKESRGVVESFSVVEKGPRH